MSTIPFFAASVPAGFPSPADDYIEASLDFNKLLVHRPAATFCLRAKGESMVGAGIFPGDILVVDRAVKPLHGSVIIAALGGEFTVKYLEIRKGEPWLVPANPTFSARKVGENEAFEVWGVVTWVLHSTLLQNGKQGEKPF